MKFLHAHNIIHCDLRPCNILLDDSLYPKISDFGLSKEISQDNASSQINSGFKGTPAYVAPEVWSKYEYKKPADVYAFAFTVYEIITNQKCYSDFDDFFVFYREVVIKSKRPDFNCFIPDCYKNLITKCWSSDPDLRPTFEEIVNELETNIEFITDCIDKDEYVLYIDSVNQNYKEQFHVNFNDFNTIQRTVNSNESNENDDTSFTEQAGKQKINESISSFSLFNSTKHCSMIFDPNLIQELITSRQPTKLIHYLNDNCSYEITSSIFNQCLKEAPDMYSALCKEGVSLHNAVSLHKFAILLISNSKKKENFDKARLYLEKAIQGGFLLSHFSLAHLLHAHYGESSRAFVVAQEGAKKGEKYSKCLLGHFIANGIGTDKNRQKGVSMMIESGAVDFYSRFATEIGLYYLEDEVKLNEAFKWFEKAYLTNKTNVAINNYGLCFLKGIHVKKDVSKASEIFNEGVKNGDPNSMYHLAFILEQIDSEKALKFYKHAANLGNVNAQRRYSFLIKNGVR